MAEKAAVPVPEAPSKKFNPMDKVLLFSIFPGLSLSVEKQQRDYVGQNGEQRIMRGRSRQVVFDKHFVFAEMRDMEDKTLKVKDGYGNEEIVVTQVGIRNMEGYHRDFFECVRTPGMDPKVKSLYEMMHDSATKKNVTHIIKQAEEKDIYAANKVPLDTLTVMEKCMTFKMAWAAAHPGE